MEGGWGYRHRLGRKMEDVTVIDDATTASQVWSNHNFVEAEIPTEQTSVSWPEDGVLTTEWIRCLVSLFEWSSGKVPPCQFSSVFPIRVFDKLVWEASKILHREPNCVRVDDVDASSSVVVVGDTHGQLHDVVFLLRDAGWPSSTRFFIFNGDYVDRGAWGLETFLVLLAWKVLLPTRVILLRGNHESRYCTSIYGFEREVMTKYGADGKHAYRKCLGCFEGLPLAAVVADSVFTVHGGLFRTTQASASTRPKGKKGRRRMSSAIIKSEHLAIGTLEELMKVRRVVLDPPWQGSNLIPGDVLWSDPSPNPGLSPNKERGIGLLWGPDCTEEFLRKNHLKLMIRSHEGPDARQKRPGLKGMENGFTVDHDVPSGKLVTVFSAPDYPQFQATNERYNNRGAYIVLRPPDFSFPDVHNFEATRPRPKVGPYYNYMEAVDSDDEVDFHLVSPDSLGNGLLHV